MRLEAVLRRRRPAVALDQVVVALEVDPGVGLGHGRSVEDVVHQGAAGGALLDVDGLGGRRGDGVALHDVAVAAVGLAVGVGAPVADRGPDVDALAVVLLAQPGVADRVVEDEVVGAVAAQVDRLVADTGHRQALDDRADGAVGHHPLLPAGHAEADEPPVLRAVEVEGVAVVLDVPAVEHRVGRAAQEDRFGGGPGLRGHEVTLVAAVGQDDRLSRAGHVERCLQRRAVGDVHGGLGAVDRLSGRERPLSCGPGVGQKRRLRGLLLLLFLLGLFGLVRLLGLVRGRRGLGRQLGELLQRRRPRGTPARAARSPRPRRAPAPATGARRRSP